MLSRFMRDNRIVFRPRRDLIAAKFGIIRDVRPSNTMRSTAPFAVSAAPAEANPLLILRAHIVRTVKGKWKCFML